MKQIPPSVIIFPNLVLYLLSGLTFLLPSDSGEKVSFAVTLLLAQIVSFGALADLFPANSLSLPILTYFVAVVTVHLSCNCCLAIFGKLAFDHLICNGVSGLT